MRGQCYSAKRRFAARHKLVPTVVGGLLCCAVVILRPTASYADGALKCLNNETLSEIDENLTTVQPAPRRLAPQQIYRRNTWTNPNKQHGTFFSFTASSDGKAGFRIMDIPEPVVAHSVTRVVNCITER